MTSQAPDGRWLSAAQRIGKALCQQAIWHEDRCTWIGRSQDEADEQTLIITPTAESLSTDLYGGTSGIALFLSELSALVPDEATRKTALGAARHALRRPLPRSGNSIGFFSGTLGVAYALARAGRLLQSAELAEAGLSLAHKVAKETPLDDPSGLPLDVISGCAGAILGLLGLSQPSATDSLLPFAIRLGEYLCRRAERTADGQWLWHELALADPNQSPNGVVWPMTGYSHGEAGVGLALLELHRVTGQKDFLDGYYGALAYEDRFYSARRGNWPDLRTWVPEAEVDDLPVWGVTWCHGSPGILLSRLRALSLLPELSGRLLPQIQGALRSTLEAVKTRRAGPRQDATLCHGGAGYGDILLLAGTLLGQQALHDEALQIGADLLKEEQPGASYLTGVPSGGPNPSLLVGTAGIGQFFLRLQDPTIPSLLLSPYAS